MRNLNICVQACLAGLLPPSGYLKWNPVLAWQPVPVHTRPQAEDSLLSNCHTACPHLNTIRQQVRLSPAVSCPAVSCVAGPGRTRGITAARGTLRTPGLPFIALRLAGCLHLIDFVSHSLLSCKVDSLEKLDWLYDTLLIEQIYNKVILQYLPLKWFTQHHCGDIDIPIRRYLTGRLLYSLGEISPHCAAKSSDWTAGHTNSADYRYAVWYL